MSWGMITNNLLNSVFGNPLFIALIFVLGVLLLLLMIRAPIYMVLAMLGLVSYYMLKAGLFPGWIFFLVILFIGVLITKGLVNLFYSEN